MQLKKHFSEDDLNRHRMFKMLVQNGSFDLKGNAVIQAAQLFAWFEGLDGKIRSQIEEDKKQGAPKVTEGAAKKSK